MKKKQEKIDSVSALRDLIARLVEPSAPCMSRSKRHRLKPQPQMDGITSYCISLLQIQLISPLHKLLSQRHEAIVINHKASNLNNFYQISVTPFLAEIKLE